MRNRTIIFSFEYNTVNDPHIKFALILFISALFSVFSDSIMDDIANLN